MPKVSVIIPSYNHAQYLPQRIDSILQQTYQDFELLILDDRSPDNSRAVIEQYSAQNHAIRVVFNEHNSGSTFFQWKRGLAMAQGEYLWIAESDDFAEPNFLAELVPLLEADRTLALAYCNSRIVDEYNTPAGTTAEWKNALYKTTHWAHDFTVSGRQELNDYLSKNCTINNASSVIFRKQALLDAGGIDTSFRYTGDWLMYQKLCLQGGIAYRAACLSNYREHSNNTSKEGTIDSRDRLERQKCFAFIFNKGLSPQAKQEMLDEGSKEFVAISYDLLHQSKKPGLLANYVRQIGAINWQYVANIQLRALRLLAAKLGRRKSK